MSLRRTPAARHSNSAIALGDSTGVLATIAEAQAANAAWNYANAQAVEAPATLYEKGIESFQPWVLTFTQTVEKAGMYGGWKVKHEIVLSKGVYSRLRAMVNSLSAAVEPVYEGNGWTISQPGDVYKVCSAPDQSTGRWVFSKMLQGDQLKKAESHALEAGGGPVTLPFWVIPAGLASPEDALRVIFGVTLAAAEIKVEINDVSYIITNTTGTAGQMSVFSLTRASYLRDKA